MADKTQKEKIREKWLDLFRNGLPTTLTFSATGITTLHPDFIRELDLTIKETEERIVREVEGMYKKKSEMGHYRQKHSKEVYNQALNDIINLIRNK